MSLAFNAGHICTRVKCQKRPCAHWKWRKSWWPTMAVSVTEKAFSPNYICPWGWCIFLMQCQMIECDQSNDHQVISAIELRSMTILNCYNLRFLQVFIICILSDEKYQHFQDVLTTYIEKHFSAALAHKYVQSNSDLSVTTVF